MGKFMFGCSIGFIVTMAMLYFAERTKAHEVCYRLHGATDVSYSGGKWNCVGMTLTPISIE